MGIYLKGHKPRLYLGARPVIKVFLNGQAVYAAEEYPLENGVLDGKVSLRGFEESEENVKYSLSQHGNATSENVPKTGTAMVVGLDLSGFRYLDLSGTYQSNSYWGEKTFCQFGIDTADVTLFEYSGYKDMDEPPVSYQKRIDVSGYEGVHNLVFLCQVHAQVGHEGYTSQINLTLNTIRLQNEE